MKHYIILALINLFLCKGIVGSKIPITIREEYDFDSSQKEFSLQYSKATEKPSIFILFYEKSGGGAYVVVKNPSSDINRIWIDDDNDDGNINFPFTKNGTYSITFELIAQNIKGKFKIFSSDMPINIDINKDISFNDIFMRTSSDPYPLIFSLEKNLSENIIKRLIQLGIPSMYISENGNDYKQVFGEFIYFNKDSNYLIKLEFLKRENEDEPISFFINGFSIINFESNLIKIEDFSIGSKSYNNIKYLFTKINLKYNNKFYVRTSYDLKFAYIDNEELYNNFPNEIQYLEFNDLLKNKELIKIEKPQDKDYMILFIEFKAQEINSIDFIEEIQIDLGKENQFSGVNMLFNLNYEKKINENALLCLFYEFKKENEEAIEIKIFEDISNVQYKTIFEISRDSFNFIAENSGEYLILLNSNKTVTGNFIIVSSEYEFSIDANKEIYFHNDFKEEIKFQSILEFSISNIDKNYKKLFSSINDLEDIISYKKENEEFVQMKKGLFLYGKGDSIVIKLDIKKITSNDYIHISNLDEENILNLKFNYEYKFPNPINGIFKINYLSSPYFKIEADDSNRYYISYVDKTIYDTIDKCLENLIFNEYKDTAYIKPVNEDYGILIVEILNKVINTTLTFNELDEPIKKLNFGSEQIFNYFYSKYQLDYVKKGDNEILIFIYKMSESSNNFEININGPNNFSKKEMFDNKEKIGSYAFESGENGNYEILFNSEKSYEGIFRIVRASEPIKININEIIKLNEFNTTFYPTPIIMEFNTKGLSDNTYKEFLIGKNNENLNLIQISSGESEYKKLTLNYYTFEKEKEYKIKIEYDDLGNNQYKFDQFFMNTFNFELEDFEYGSKIYQNISRPIFIKIDLTKYSKIVVKADNDPIFKIAFYNDDLDFTKILNDLIFEDLKDYIISTESYKKAVLNIQIKIEETKIEFLDGSGEDEEDEEEDDSSGEEEEEEEEKEDDKNNKNDNKVTFIILGIGGIVILLLIAIFIIYRCKKRKNRRYNIDPGKEDEELMPR